MLRWATQFDTCCFLDSNQYNIQPCTFEAALAVGVNRHLKASAGSAFPALHRFINDTRDWLFGHFGYDLKNETEALHSTHPDGIEFPDLYFFQPQIVLLIGRQEVQIGALNEEATTIFHSISACPAADTSLVGMTRPFQQRMTKAAYLAAVKALQQHIHQGDCYEVNFCQEWFAEQVRIQPLSLFLQLNTLSPAPFAAFYRIKDHYLLCASPERFLKKQGSSVLSQPMKGTVRRGQHAAEDQTLRQQLLSSPKERAENVMVVDLVRNDLSRVAASGSVQVEELCGVYSFAQVHQLVSTVHCKLRPQVPAVEVVRSAFPMGSMTGAPKIRVMQLIEAYEKTRRGLFSGAVGYFTPQQDFDFNVVIRSMLYNAANAYISFQTGSGITFYSDPEQELEECYLKARAMQKAGKA